MRKDYELLSKFYKKLQEGIDYTIWSDIVVDFCDEEQEILEVGCGDGTLADILVKKDYHVDAFDLSPSMIEEAKKVNSDINFYVDDMRSFKTEKKYPTIICFMDTLNYLTTNKDIEAFFKSSYDALEESGILMFDIHKEENLSNFDGYKETFKVGDEEIKWNSYIDDNEVTIVNHHMDFGDSGIEIHQQKIEEQNYYHGFYNNLFHTIEILEDHYRIYLVLKKRK